VNPDFKKIWESQLALSDDENLGWYIDTLHSWNAARLCTAVHQAVMGNV
jgi:hypothetical protein